MRAETSFTVSGLLTQCGAGVRGKGRARDEVWLDGNVEILIAEGNNNCSNGSGTCLRQSGTGEAGGFQPLTAFNRHRVSP